MPGNEIVIDLKNLNIRGEVLDLGFQGKGIIYRALKKPKTIDAHDETAAAVENAGDYNWVCGYPDRLPFTDNSFDSIVSFFSLSIIRSNHLRRKTVKEISRVLRKNGKLYIWDNSVEKLSLGYKKEIKVLLPGDCSEKYQFRQFGIPKSFGIDSVLPVVSRYFTVNEYKDNGGYFYICAAVKKVPQ